MSGWVVPLPKGYIRTPYRKDRPVGAPESPDKHLQKTLCRLLLVTQQGLSLVPKAGSLLPTTG